MDRKKTDYTPVIFLVVYLLYKFFGGWLYGVLDAFTNLNALSLEFIFLALDISLALGVVFLVFRVGHGEIFKGSHFRWWYLFLPFLAFLAFYASVWLISSLMPVVSGNQETIRSSLRNPSSQFMVGLTLFEMAILGPITEEIFYRAGMMTFFFPHSKFYLDILVSALVFGGAHMVFFGGTFGAFLIYFVYGLIFAGIFRLTKSIYWSMFSHIAWNIFINWSVIYSFLYFL